jgi:Ca2+-binding EF-hand superfamily protein
MDLVLKKQATSKNLGLSEIDLIGEMVIDIFDTFDVDNNGTLDMQEFKQFINECANLLGNDKSGLSSLQEKLKSVNVEEAFKASDVDGSGDISRTEMFTFLNNLCGQEELLDVNVTVE